MALWFRLSSFFRADSVSFSQVFNSRTRYLAVSRPIQTFGQKAVGFLLFKRRCSMRRSWELILLPSTWRYFGWRTFQAFLSLNTTTEMCWFVSQLWFQKVKPKLLFKPCGFPLNFQLTSPSFSVCSASSIIFTLLSGVATVGAGGAVVGATSSNSTGSSLSWKMLKQKRPDDARCVFSFYIHVLVRKRVPKLKKCHFGSKGWFLNFVPAPPSRAPAHRLAAARHKGPKSRAGFDTRPVERFMDWGRWCP